MTLSTKIKLAVVSGLLLSAPAIWSIDRIEVSAHEGEVHTVAQEDSEEEQDTDEPATYKYTAQAGDSYTLMARKAVQSYGKVHGVKLSLAQIIFAEANLTIEAGSPLLDLGQPIEIGEDKVKNWVEAAGKLTAEQEAAWDVYVAGADFNTDHVGEPQS